MIEPVRVGRHHGSGRWRYDGRSSRLAGCMTFTLSGQAEPEQDVGLGCKSEDPPPLTCFLQATFPNTNHHLGSRGSNVSRLTTELRFKVMAPKGTQPRQDSRSVLDMVELRLNRHQQTRK